MRELKLRISLCLAERGALAAPQECLDPDHELLEIEGLGEVVVGAGVEAADLVLGAAEGREHQDGDLGGALVAPQALTEGETVDLGEHQVEQDHIGAVLNGKGLALDAVSGPLDIEAAVLKVSGDEIEHVAVIFDEQDGGLHGCSRRGESSWVPG